MRRLLPYLGLSLFVLHGCNKPDAPKTTQADKTLNYLSDKTQTPPESPYRCEELISQSRYNEAFSLCLQKAQNGDVDTQYRLGNMFIEGKFGTTDYEQGTFWLLKAAAQGLPEAQFAIAKLYESGNGLNKDDSLALKWLLLSVKGNYIPAQELLGEFYFQGKADAKDLTEARQWFTQSATQGNPLSQYYLGKIYLYGIGLNRNPYLGERYFMQAAEQGHAKAQLEIAKLYQEGIVIPKNDVLAYKWYQAAASQDEPEALSVVGLSMIENALSQNHSIDQGATYLKRAADKGYYPAQYALATLFLDGHPVLKDRFIAIEYLRQAALSGSVDAQIKLAKILVDFSLPQYDKVAFYWMSQAATKNSDAEYHLGSYYLDGIGTEVDYDRAYQIFNTLAAQNNHLAEMKLGQMCYYGKGVDKDLEAAKKWFLRAARAGEKDAKNWVAILFRDGFDTTENSDVQTEISQWVSYAAEKGEPEAVYLKGMNHLYGKFNSEQNVPHGLELIEMAANSNFVPAQRELGMIYEQGLFGLFSNDKAYSWYLKAAQNGDGFAQFRLAYMYYTGNGIAKNDIQSYAWANLAAMSGKVEASELRDEISQNLESADLAKAREVAQNYFNEHKSNINGFAMP